ncbi:MAG: hypothetical protein ACFB51_17635 [Anaerolineae bacterium]
MASARRRKNTNPLSRVLKGLLVVAGLYAVVLVGRGLWMNTGTPELVDVQGFVDHGDIPVSQPIRSELVLRNEGSGPLRLTEAPFVQVVEGCCPPEVHASRTVVPPGEEVVIYMDYTMHAGMGGPHDFRVHVMTNDPNQPVVQLQVLSNWLE